MEQHQLPALYSEEENSLQLISLQFIGFQLHVLLRALFPLCSQFFAQPMLFQMFLLNLRGQLTWTLSDLQEMDDFTNPEVFYNPT